MRYYDRIKELTKNVPVELVDFEQSRDPARTHTQASSNIITNKEQGDWAENLVTRAINEKSKNFVAVKYGKSDDLVAGEDGFDTFYQDFQTELDTIGKRPDLLIFNKSDFDNNLGLDISQIPHHQITDYVKKAIAGIEVRSSAFLIEKYSDVMKKRTQKYLEKAIELKDKLLNQFNDVLEQDNRKKYIPILESITEETISAVSFRVPGWHSNARLVEVNKLFGDLKHSLNEIQKRNELSITVKNEDIQVVYKWIEIFGVPHYYFQVFFDKVIGISFENILEIISDETNEDKSYKTERNTKNQDKPTIHIYSSNSKTIATKVDEPEHSSIRRELNRGALLFYVTFKGGTAYLDIENLKNILEIKNNDF